MKAPFRPTRRSASLAIAALVAAPAAVVRARAEEPAWRHGVSLFGDLKYPAGFKHFDYVNPQAPKGGVARSLTPGTFDNFNLVVEGAKGNIPRGIALVYDSLLVDSLDEASTQYGLLAESVKYPSDISSATFRLRAEARWHDGKPVTAEDVIFSFDVLKANSPRQSTYYRHIVRAEKTGERDITFTFDAPGNRELPSILGQLNVLPKHWWEGTDASGKKRDVTATTLEPPLGSGAYRIKEFVVGRSMVFERVKDYWGADVNVNIGSNNFDELRYEYFRDTTVAVEAFKGDVVDWRVENSAKAWATAYDFPAVTDKRVVREEFPIRNFGRMQGFVFNMRREKFRDPRVRLAFNYAYDFEEANKRLLYSLYRRIDSYFSGTELASSGVPGGPRAGAFLTASATPRNVEAQELAILETVRDKVPPELFTKPYANPVGGNPENVRANLREATRLLRMAGYEVRNQKLVNAATGEPFTVEFLDHDPNGERHVLFYKEALDRLGMTVSIRTIDDAQYENRTRSFDFDIVNELWAESLSPGNEQREFWGSQAADSPGSRNLAGIKNPAVDMLIDRVIFAKDRTELIAASRALDRVLLWNHYVLPTFTSDKMRTLRWDRFGRPDELPLYGLSGFPTVWWWDAERAAKVGSRR